jgi:hypothetical protein
MGKGRSHGPKGHTCGPKKHSCGGDVKAPVSSTCPHGFASVVTESGDDGKQRVANTPKQQEVKKSGHSKSAKATIKKEKNSISIKVDISPYFKKSTSSRAYANHQESDFVQDVSNLDIPSKVHEALMRKKGKLMSSGVIALSEDGKYNNGVPAPIIKRMTSQSSKPTVYESIPIVQKVLTPCKLSHRLPIFDCYLNPTVRDGTETKEQLAQNEALIDQMLKDVLNGFLDDNLDEEGIPNIIPDFADN